MERLGRSLLWQSVITVAGTLILLIGLAIALSAEDSVLGWVLAGSGALIAVASVVVRRELIKANRRDRGKSRKAS